MTPKDAGVPRPEELVRKYFEEGLSPEDTAKLSEALRSNPDLARQFAEATRDELLLHQLHEPALRAETGRPSTRRASRRPLLRESRDRMKSFWMIALAAAGVLVAFTLLLTLPGAGAPDKSPSAKRGDSASEPEKSPPTPRLPEDKPVPQDVDDVRPALPNPGKAVPSRGAPAKRLDPPKESPTDTSRPAVADKGKPAPGKNPSPDAGVPKKPQDTRVAVGTLEEVKGVVEVSSGGKKRAARGGETLLADDVLETAAEESAAVLTYADGTKLEVGKDTRLEKLTLEGGKRLRVARGMVNAEVARQPQREPMVLETPHGEAVVLGTTLRMVVDLDPKIGTRLEVKEGRVRLKRTVDGKTVLVTSGHYAVAAAGVPLTAEDLPIDEILLLPSEGKSVGGLFRFVKDADSYGGRAIEALRRSNFNGQDFSRAEYAAFSFRADAGKEYHVWIRGRTLKPGDIGADAFVIEVPGADVKEAPAAGAGGWGKGRAFFNGFALQEGYWWLGGNFDTGIDGRQPVTVRFARAGRQVIKVYATEPPFRIDAIWLSTTRKTRPDADMRIQGASSN